MESHLLNTGFKENAIFDHCMCVNSTHTCVFPLLTFNSQLPWNPPPCRSRVPQGGKVLNLSVASPSAPKKLPKAQRR